MSEKHRKWLRTASTVADTVTIIIIFLVTVWSFIRFLNTAPEWAMWMALMVGGWKMLTTKET